MKILIVSDSHGNYTNLEKALTDNSDVDMLIHLGDGEREFNRLQEKFGAYSYRYVRGNNDRDNYELKQYLDIEGHRILICHGHYFYVRSGVKNLVDDAKANGCDIVFFGHTHRRCSEKRHGITLINPGSLWLQRDGTPPSYAIAEINGEKCTFSIYDLCE